MRLEPPTQVGYAPAAFLMVILDTTAEEEESSATKKGLENSTDENQVGGWVGQEGERRKSYSAAVIDGIKRNSRIYVGDSIVRKTDTRLSKEEDVVVCLPGARISLWVIMKKWDVPPNVVAILKCLHRDMTVRILVDIQRAHQ